MIAGSSDTYDLRVAVSTTDIAVFSAGERLPLDGPSGIGTFLAGRFGFPQGEAVDFDTFQFTGATAR